MKETEYWHRTDTFEQKLDLLKAAAERRDFRLARALTESLKNTLVFAQQEEESLGVPLLRADLFELCPDETHKYARHGMLKIQLERPTRVIRGDRDGRVL